MGMLPNLLAILALVGGWFYGTAVFLWWPLLPLLLLGLGLIRAIWSERRFWKFQVVLGCLYTGVLLGLMVTLFSRYSLWLGLPAALGVLLVGLFLPGYVSSFLWGLVLWRTRPAGWSSPGVQLREDVLRQSPFRIEEQYKITEERSGGGVQDQQIGETEFNVMLGERIAYSIDSMTDSMTSIETWLLERYRHYRRLRHLPVHVSTEPPRTVEREETQVVQPYLSSDWEQSHKLSRAEVLAFAPYSITIEAEWGQMLVMYTPDGEWELLDLEGQSPIRAGPGTLPSSVPWLQSSGSVKLRLKASGTIIAIFDDLPSAEAEVLARYSNRRILNATHDTHDEAHQDAATLPPHLN